MGNVEAESAVIGGLLLESDKLMPEISLELLPEDFSSSAYREIYKTFLDMFKRGVPVDSATLKSYLPEGTKEDCFELAINAAKTVPTLRRVKEYTKLVKRAGMAKRAKEKAMQFIEAIDANEPESQCQRKASEIVQVYSSIKSSADCVNAKDGYLSFCSSQDQKKEYLKTGFSRLDRNLYIAPGNYIVIGGRPSAGKTAFTLQIMLNVSGKHKALYFSLETSPEIIFERLISCYAKIPLKSIKMRNLTDDQWLKAHQAFDTFSKKRFSVIKAAGYGVEQIRSEIIRNKAEIAFIDYLTLIQSEGKNMLDKATNISIGLHNLAQQTGCVLIVLSQLNREGKNEPDMTSLRESGQIEQDADAILIISQDEDESERKIKIVKNKEGITGTIPFHFDGAFQTFYCIDS